jgi:phosphopantetheine adenylyltransferase
LAPLMTIGMMVACAWMAVIKPPFLKGPKCPSADVRGVRSAKDWEYETELYQVHKILWPEIEMLCLAADPKFTTVSSSFVREILHYQGDISKLVPAAVYALMQED